ncbi:hypothetical protein [Natronorubrum sp. FCH18a]|uniref:hypothetical protein n=1 Tax=Natronorubrum sp. FCH18a TaxID=3447018 RepID=UPI003F50DD6A
MSGEGFGLSTRKDVTGAVILAMEDTTYLLNLYTDADWVVDREFPHPRGIGEDELDEFVNMLVNEFEDYYRENILSSPSSE